MFRLLRWFCLLIILAMVAAGVVIYSVSQERDRREVHTAEELAPRAGHFIQAADVRLFVQEAGPANGPAIVFINGPGTWSEVWRQPLTELGRLGYHAIALDLPPFGFSQRPDPSTYDKRHQALRIFGLLDTLKIDRAVLVGHSFGAGPVVEAAIVAPQRVRGLVLVDAMLEIRNKQEGPPTETSKIIDYLAESPVEREWLVSCFLTNPDFTRQLLEFAVADPASAKRSWVTQLQSPLGIRGTTEAVDDWLANMLTKERPGFSEFQWSYPWLKMPMVLIWGQRDRLAPIADAELIHGLAPQSRLIVLDNVGHLPQIEDPDGFSRQLAEAVKTLAPPRQGHAQ